MNIKIDDPELQAGLKKQMESTGSRSIEETLLRLLETQEEQDRWPAEDRAAINQQIRRGIHQLDRGKGIPEHELDTHLAKLKAKPESWQDFFDLADQSGVRDEFLRGRADSFPQKRKLF